MSCNLRAICVPGNSTLLVTIPALVDDDATAVVAATVQITGITDTGGDAVGADEMPITLAHVSAGKYEGSIPHDIGMANGRRYTVTIQATSGSLVRTWRQPVVVAN
jgi:hypothetical protein